jgi:AcrR family transcriptional regulator
MTSTDRQPKRRGRPPTGGREAILEAALAVLREQGIAQLTSREVASRAGVSDASVYYHFHDRAGLLEAIFECGMRPLLLVGAEEPDAREPLTILNRAADRLEQFFDDVLPILHAAQSDPDLKRAVARYVELKDLGPHKGVDAISGYLRAQQRAGTLSAAFDPDAVALFVIDTSFARAVRRQMRLGSEERLPSRRAVMDQVWRLIQPE